jgi:hypothetical protein
MLVIVRKTNKNNQWKTVNWSTLSGRGLEQRFETQFHRVHIRSLGGKPFSVRLSEHTKAWKDSKLTAVIFLPKKRMSYYMSESCRLTPQSQFHCTELRGGWARPGGPMLFLQHRLGSLQSIMVCPSTPRKVCAMYTTCSSQESIVPSPRTLSRLSFLLSVRLAQLGSIVKRGMHSWLKDEAPLHFSFSLLPAL